MADILEPRRHLDLEGSYNIRDTGGYRTAYGTRVRWKTLLRGDALNRLTPAAKTALVGYGVRTVIDLRGSVEVEVAPDVFVGSNDVVYHHQDMIGDDIMAELTASPGSVTGMQGVIQSYSMFLDRRRQAVCNTLATLAAPGTLPAIVHCTGGKDRTGIITALALGIAGVPVQTIAQDYALSSHFLMTRSLSKEGNSPTIESGISTWDDYQEYFCPPSAMLGTLQYLEDHYGGIEEYALGGGLSRENLERIRNALVE